MYYLVSEHPGKGNPKPGCIVVLKARSRTDQGQILLACLGNEQSRKWIEAFRKAFIEMITGLKGYSKRHIVRTIKHFLKQFLSENPIQDSSPLVCGIICVDHTFFRFQNTGMIYFLNTKWGYGNAGLKCTPDPFCVVECGTYEEQVGILLMACLADGNNYMTDEEETDWFRILRADNVKNGRQMEKRLHDSMEYFFKRQHTIGPVIWIIPSETPESVLDSEKECDTQ